MFTTRAILLTSLFMTGSSLAADMPFIEVDPGSLTSFRERRTHKPFVAVGVNYFDHETGWAPKLWQKFDEARVRRQLTLIHDQGFNTIRVFLTLGSFHREAGVVTADGEALFRKLLAICHELNIYVIPSGPDHWEGVPPWRNGDNFADEKILKAEETWWKAFAERFRDEPAILAWDLLNEPSVGWDSPAMRTKWNEWLRRKYPTDAETLGAWKIGPQTRPAGSEIIDQKGQFTIPPGEAEPGSQRLFDFQTFRESIGDEWARRHSEAIRSVDKNHLITIGHIQWAVPIALPVVRHYAGFNMSSNAKYVDFVTVHFYPLVVPRPCDGPQGVRASASYLEAMLYLCSVGKPVMIGEFGWYGGGELRVNGVLHLPAKPVEHQVEWCKELLAVSRGRVCGWLNWAMCDVTNATDLTIWSGCWTSNLKLKPWGEMFGRFADEVTVRPDAPHPYSPALTSFKFDRKAMLTDHEAGNAYRRKLLEAATPTTSRP